MENFYQAIMYDDFKDWKKQQKLLRQIYQLDIRVERLQKEEEKSLLLNEKALLEKEIKILS
ncbi:hypothetical protein LKM00_26390 [Bacillus wiedmannii]|uniref:hypothetical protein n=1 Tax=Bacillus wiedmannii TaxID=1890302 RepID=UPI001E28EADB|nr:hypothetical protein [Bacillus wiedmannii]MCC2380930.1 hypothetical protein [Bacillus wiedmannii]MCC2425393.1 hypothetical protein [Bacillus wiedmannii]